MSLQGYQEYMEIKAETLADPGGGGAGGFNPSQSFSFACQFGPTFSLTLTPTPLQEFLDPPGLRT